MTGLKMLVYFKNKMIDRLNCSDNKVPFTIIAILVFWQLVSCKPDQNRSESGEETISQPIELDYAKGFTVSYQDNAKWVTLTQPYQGATEEFRYLLVQKGDEIPSHDPRIEVIQIPIETIVCTSTTHIPLLDYLGETDKLVGFPTTDYISSPSMRQRIDSGWVQDLGVDKEMNIELLISLNPEMVMSYSTIGELRQQQKIRDLGISVVLNAEFLEPHPLGRAEWIKFMALFFNKEKMADSIFTEIERGYLNTEQLARDLSVEPTVMSGIVYGDTWFLPGGKNYASTLLDNAGASYIWKSDSSSGFLELSFEAVYEKARTADLWIGVASFENLAQIKAADNRYTRFHSFVSGEVYTYDARKGAKGGSEYLELGYLRPDIILKDIVNISHPELLPDYELYFYKKLK